VSADLLATIVAATRRIVAVRQQREPLAVLRERVARLGPRTTSPGTPASTPAARGGRFLEAIGRRDRLNVIAECKRRSPSRGVLRADYDPAAIARDYAAAGAAAVSVLTEPTFFDGALEHLTAVRDALKESQDAVPVLRKDFIVSEYQVLEAKAAGADAVLLIVAALDPAALRSLAEFAADWGMDAVVEVHNAQELSAALEAGARIVGVNNRNLRTLEVDVRASEALIALMPPDVVAISESGLRTPDDLARLRELGYRAFLVGERLMTVADPGRALRELLAGVACS
jgi:indole-3-glycerol phosphate synthase